VLVRGADALDSKSCVSAAVKGVEAGTCLNGVVVVRSRSLPADPTAQTKFKIKSKFLCYRQQTVQTENGPSQRRYTTEQKWFERAERLTLSPQSCSQVPDEGGMYRLEFAARIDVPTGLCDTFETSAKLKKFRVFTTLRVKVSFDCMQMRLKSGKRELQIVARRLSMEQLSPMRPKSVAEEGSKMKVSVDLTEPVHPEGSVVAINTVIENDDSSALSKGEVSLVRQINYNVLHDVGHVIGAEVRSNLVEEKLRGLELQPSTRNMRSFALTVPDDILVAPCVLRKDKFYQEVSYFVKLRLQRLGRDFRVKVPISIALKPSKYLSPAAGQWNVAVQYAPFTQKVQVHVLKVFLSAARDLPRMDGPLGRADPFVTLLVNGKYFRCSSVKSYTRSPSWDESFYVSLSQEEVQAAPRIEIKCYDADRIRSDDLIGEVERGILMNNADLGQLRWYKLVKHKKNTSRERGELLLSYSWGSTG